MAIEHIDNLEIPITKLLLDKVVSFLLLLLTSPVSLFIILGIKINGLFDKADKGPLFFVETRISAGKPFDLYKFRIFKVSATRLIGQPGVITKSVENDPVNLTRMGKKLKKWGLDELPQLWNIIKGDMALVGPRPAPLNEYEVELAQGIFRKKVIRTGLTGPVQVMKGTQRTKEQEIQADNDYIEEMKGAGLISALIIDLKILAKTVRVFLRRTGE